MTASRYVQGALTCTTPLSQPIIITQYGRHPDLLIRGLPNPFCAWILEEPDWTPGLLVRCPWCGCPTYVPMSNVFCCPVCDSEAHLVTSVGQSVLHRRDEVFFFQPGPTEAERLLTRSDFKCMSCWVTRHPQRDDLPDILVVTDLCSYEQAERYLRPVRDFVTLGHPYGEGLMLEGEHLQPFPLKGFREIFVTTPTMRINGAHFVTTTRKPKRKHIFGHIAAVIRHYLAYGEICKDAPQTILADEKFIWYLYTYELAMPWNELSQLLWIPHDDVRLRNRLYSSPQQSV